MKTSQLILLLSTLFLVSSANAYIGPGAGLSAIGSLIALVFAISIALIGFVWFPLKRLKNSKKNASQSEQHTEDLEDDFAERK